MNVFAKISSKSPPFNPTKNLFRYFLCSISLTSSFQLWKPETNFAKQNVMNFPKLCALNNKLN